MKTGSQSKTRADRRRWFGRLPGSHPCLGTYVVGDPLTGHMDAGSSVAYSPDATIVSASTDRTLRLWPAYADATMLCAKLTSNMSHKQRRDWVLPDIDYIEACPDLPGAPD